MPDDRTHVDPNAAEQDLAFSYASSDLVAALRLLFDLDDRLGTIARTTRDPLLAQIRLTWWKEALSALEQAQPPAEPLLQSLAADILPRGVSGATLAGLVDGWETLLEETPDLDRIAHDRGARLFAAAAQLLGAALPTPAAGEGWALADIATHSLDPALAAQARALARDRLAGVMASRWPARLRALGALALIARFDVADQPPPVAGPRRVARLAWHRLSGR